MNVRINQINKIRKKCFSHLSMYAGALIATRVSFIFSFWLFGDVAFIDATHARGKILRALMRIDVDRIALIS